jgi:signal transduction histidine kinase
VTATLSLAALADQRLLCGWIKGSPVWVAHPPHPCHNIPMADKSGSHPEDTEDSSSSNVGGGRRAKSGEDLHAADSRIQDYQRQLRRLASELSLAEARERREIASDLHDHIGQALAFVSQKVSVMRGNSIFSGMDEDFSQILSILDQAIRYTRDLTVEISPPILYDIGLAAAIDWQAERALKIYNLKVSFAQSGAPSEIAEDVKAFTFKAVQELINNVAKHAGAGKAEIRLNWEEDEFEVVVSDDGRGFDTSKLSGGLSADCCFGLFSIRERLSYMGGALAVESSPGNGTRVSMRTPYRITEEA